MRHDPEDEEASPPPRPSGVRGWVWVVSLLAYFASFGMPVVGDRWPEGSGLAMFLITLVVPVCGTLAWIANPLLWMAWRRYNGGDDVGAFRCSVAAASFGSWPGIVAVVESRGTEPVLGLGYWTWLGSIGLIVLASACGRWLAQVSPDGGFDEPAAS